MKKVTLLFGAFIALFFISCEGPAGPPGYDGFDGAQGPPGADGSEFEAIVFEVEIDLTLNSGDNTYEFGESFSDHSIELFPDDAILVYRLEAVEDGLDIWRQLPQPFFSNQGLLYYNFDFTQVDYKLYVEPDFDASIVPTDLVTNQIFRVFIVPANLGLSSKLDKSNINAVMKSMGIEEKNVQRFKMN